MYSFIRNDNNSWSSYSRLYEVYDNNELITCLVFGYDKILNKYFLCQLGNYMLSDKYDLTEEKIDSNKTLTAMYQFLSLSFLLDTSDILSANINNLPDITIDNIYIYILLK